MNLETKKDLINNQSNKLLGVDESELLKLRAVFRTSGTSGSPLFVPMNEMDLEKVTDVGAKCFINAGVTPGMRVIHCLNYRMWAGGLLDTLSLMKAKAAVIPFGTGGTEELISTILKLKVDAISCTPSYMGVIEKVAQEKFGLKPNQLGLKLGLFGGEAGIQNPEFRNKINSLWGIQAIDANYGSADSISILASENYIKKDGLTYLASEIATPYILVDNNLESPRKGLIGELVIDSKYSGMSSRNMYRLGDIIEVLSDGDEFRFKILGRSDEMIVVKGINLYPDTIRSVISEIEYEYSITTQYQLHVSASDPIEKLVLYVSFMDNLSFSESVLEKIKSELHIKTGLNIEVENKPINLGSTDKIKLVVRDL